MTILLLLIPLSLMLVGVAAWAFVWAVRGGQFDDLDTPALDILGEDRADVAGDATLGTDVSIGGCTGGCTGSETNIGTSTSTDASTNTNTNINTSTSTSTSTSTNPDAD